jgi:hypothetical protein
MGVAGGDGRPMAAGVGDGPAPRWTLGAGGVGVVGEEGEGVGEDAGTAGRLAGADAGTAVSSGDASGLPRSR